MLRAGKSGGRRRDVPGPSVGEAEEEGLEARRHEDHLRGPEFYAKTPKIRAIYSPFGSAHEEGPRDAPRAQGYLLLGHFGGQKESFVCHVHFIGRDHEGYGHRGERQRVGLGYYDWQGSMGQVRPGDERPRIGRVHQRGAARVRNSLYFFPQAYVHTLASLSVSASHSA